MLYKVYTLRKFAVQVEALCRPSREFPRRYLLRAEYRRFRVAGRRYRNTHIYDLYRRYLALGLLESCETAVEELRFRHR